ncbi:MAG: restriction endonuclease subunit S [Verrucomicrobiota bacterium]
MTNSKLKIQNSQFSRYPRYKVSGVEWLSDVPEHWEVSRSRRVFVQRKELARPHDPQLSATQAYGVIPQADYEERIGRKVVKISMHLEKRKHVEPDDFVISMRSFQGGLERAWARGCIRSSYTIIQPLVKVAPSYFTYLFKSPQYIASLQTTGSFIRDGQDLTYENFILVDLPVPPLEEQARIGSFLDQNTAEIDALIAKKQRQIELLDEQKAILINRAVTRGLNPNAKLKPSGIEWIGEIPEHWEVKNLKHASTAIGTGRTPSSVAQAEDLPDGVHWYTPGDYQNNGFLDASDRRAKSTRSETVETFPAGSLFYIGIGATLGRVNISLHEAGCNQQINVIVINSAAHSSEYMLHLLTSGREFIFSSSDFTTLPILNRSKTAALSIVAPPKEEQEAIAAFCADLILKIQAVQMKVTENIQSLKAFRSSLIAHAVTGRIKV